ncbi:enhanced level of genomic instability 1 [Battus philenor]|uniref:enhanced level of genomic instability 1 n=1 Tax=Battus philenor TaxID=42288 RepID=UPI0035CF1583
MSICLDAVVFKEKEKETVSSRRNVHKNGRVVLKDRENTLKSKRNDTLKRKLKKYKLRKDGKEDQEIIEVSQSFNTSLIIKSPKNQVNKQAITGADNKELEVKKEFKMGKIKVNTFSSEATEVNDINSMSPKESSKSSQDKQDKKQTDAFKLLMDSRNKVIGSNSPGKDRTIEISPEEEIIEKKDLKARRMLSLQKMAQAKGALQKQEQEELRESFIKNKMEKRAEHLKSILSKSVLNINKKTNNKHNTDTNLSEEIKTLLKTENILSYKMVPCNQAEKPVCLPGSHFFKSSSNKPVSEEEEQFLKKLSPSLRKKENMLCYFNIITKDDEGMSVESALSENENHDNDKETIIKVKFARRCKKKTKERTVATASLGSAKNNELIEKVSFTDNDFENIEKSKKQKRKREQHIETKALDSMAETSTSTRPKRNTRKPTKLIENVTISSSDEELHIFTPKKKKSSVSKIEQIPSKSIKNETVKEKNNFKQDPNKVSKLNSLSSVIQGKKQSKLAPIFSTKPQLTNEEIKARQKFLHSGIPKHLKKISNVQVNNTLNCDVFYTVSHIQQLASNCLEKNTDFLSLPLFDDYEVNVRNVQQNLFQSLLELDHMEANVIFDVKNNIEATLKSMKELYTKFPVYRTYHSLKAKSRGELGNSHYNNLDNSVEIINGISDICNDNPDKLKWTDKYKATSTKQIIGNFDSIKELRKWLTSWSENVVMVKNDSDSSDFFCSDTDSGDVIRMRNNLLILSGKPGSGKTSSVYAVASELSMKVIEVNASSKRTGKIMLQDLQEATQSHKVDRQRDYIENSQKSIDKDVIDLNNSKKRKKVTKSKERLSQKSVFTKKDINNEQFSSQESLRTDMSLILIDDADIVFDQDEGFCSAIAQLVHSSKRPVILITESLQCPHLQKFLKYGQVIKLYPLLPRMLGTWLDIMCLADNGICYMGLGAKLLDFFKGDIRKCINHLHYYIGSQKHITKLDNGIQETEFLHTKEITDENSSMSWCGNDDVDQKMSTASGLDNAGIQYYMSKKLNNIHNPLPSLEFNVWWSLPNILGCDKSKLQLTSLKKTEKISKILEVISSTTDTFSLNDLIQHHTKVSKADITSRPWFTPENVSLTDNENFENYNRNIEIKQNISHYLMINNIEYMQKILKCEHKIDVQFPSMSHQRERDTVVDRHKTLAGYLNPSAVLDRKAVSMDYWSLCRSMCRLEKAKTDLSSKRNNRFCHYLKSLNVLCKNECFDKLGESLCLDKKS